MPDFSRPFIVASGTPITASVENDNWDAMQDAFNDSIASKVADSGIAGQLVLFNGSGVPAATTITGDVTFSGSGVSAIGNGKVTEAMLATALQAALGITARDSAEVATEQAPSSSSWHDLATVGPSVTLTVPAGGGVAYCSFAADIQDGYVGVHVGTDRAISGTPETGEAVIENLGPSYFSLPLLGFVAIPVTAGSRTFTLKYARDGAVGGNFRNRKLSVVIAGGF